MPVGELVNMETGDGVCFSTIMYGIRPQIIKKGPEEKLQV